MRVRGPHHEHQPEHDGEHGDDEDVQARVQVDSGRQPHEHLPCLVRVRVDVQDRALLRGQLTPNRAHEPGRARGTEPPREQQLLEGPVRAHGVGQEALRNAGDHVRQHLALDQTDGRDDDKADIRNKTPPTDMGGVLDVIVIGSRNPSSSDPP